MKALLALYTHRKAIGLLMRVVIDRPSQKRVKNGCANNKKQMRNGNCANLQIFGGESSFPPFHHMEVLNI